MKKVIAIIGSLRKESVNRHIFNNYKRLAKDFFVLEEGDISQIPLYNQDIEKEPGSVAALAELINHSDGVIFFTPEYNYSIPGVLKNAIDWLSRNDLKPFNNKLAAVLGGSPGNIGTARMQYHLRQVGVFLNLNFLNKPEVMIGKVFSKVTDGEITDKDTIDLLNRHIQQFAEKL
jgi:chromate reductase, NAD(P)H dehydrogenase (quinone)